MTTHPGRVRRHVYACALIAAVWVGIGLAGAVTAEAASAKKECIKSRCKPQRKACQSAFKEQFKFVKSSCPNRACRSALKKLFKQNRKHCKTALKSCKKCCKSAPASCNIEVLGDGLCGGFPTVEQCDGADAPGCPGQCRADCTCGFGTDGPGSPGAPESPGAPVPGGSVGDLEVGSARVILVDGTNSLPDPFISFDTFLVVGGFNAGTRTGAPAGEQVGNCTILSQSSPSAPIPAAFDPGSPGTMSNGAATVDLFAIGGVVGTLENAVDLHDLGFDAGQRVSFAFPGGFDIGPFSASVRVPADLGLSVPDLDDPALRFDFRKAVNLVWAAGDVSTTVNVTIAAADVDEDGVVQALGAGAISCDFPDTGTSTIPVSVTSRLPADPEFIVFTAQRVSSESASVPLTGGGNGTLTLGGLASVAWTFVGIVGQPPDLPTPKR